MSLDERGRARVSAENKGLGSQFVTDGSGDQNIASGSGVLYKVGHQINISVPDAVATGMPSLRHLQHLGDGPGRWSPGPSCADVVDWLKTRPDQHVDAGRLHLRLSGQVVAGTGTWILTTGEFLAWKDASSPRRLLWMHGIVGSGKTMLVSLVVDSIAAEIRDRDDAACVYFYFQEGQEQCPSLARVWATLLIQLLQQASGAPADKLMAKFNDPLQGSTRLDWSEYLDLFRAQAATLKTVYLVIDSLDSCAPAPGEDARQGMQAALRALPDGIRVLFTSRGDWVGQEMGPHQTLSITPTEHDVAAYVEKRIDDDGELRSLLARGRDRESVVAKVTAMTVSSNMFLLARLHMDDLGKQGTLRDINTALGRLPESASRAFAASAQQLAQRIGVDADGFESRLVTHILTWVMHAKTELSVDQVRDSFAVWSSRGEPYRDHRPAKPLPMRPCVGLVIVDREKDTLSLVHKSAETELRKHSMLPDDAHLAIGKTCLSYLLAEPCDGDEGEPPLLRYAARYWWPHLHGSRDGRRMDAEAEALVLALLRDGPKLARAFRAMEDGGGGGGGGALDGMTGLHATVHFGMPAWAERLLDSGVNVDGRCADGQTALHWAVRYGRRDMLELLLRRSADPDLGDGAGDTPLHKALVGPTPDGTPLHQAVTRPAADDAAVVEALIRGHARLDVTNTKGLSPLSSAIRSGPTSMARAMMEGQDDVDAEIFEGWTSLRQVFYHGQDMLNGAGGRAGAGEGWAQLRHAVGSHAHLLIDLLLRRGVDLNRPARDGWLPLMHAAKTGDWSKLGRLLRREPGPARVDLRDAEGRTALYWALAYGKTAAVDLLVDHGADVDEAYGDGSTPLLEAVRWRNGTAWPLVRLGADVNSAACGTTPLVQAVRCGDDDTAWVLLRAGARPDERDGAGRPALAYAVERRDRRLAWLLLARGASAAGWGGAEPAGRAGPGGAPGPEAPDRGPPEHSPLRLALACDDLSLAWLLLEHGAPAGPALLHWAVAAGRLGAARLLVGRGVSVDARDAGWSTPLHLAVQSPHRPGDMTALLAPWARRLDAVDAAGHTALALAALRCRPEPVRVLLRHGARCDAAAPDGVTALHLAASHGFPEGVRLLLDAGGDANAMDDVGFTPLHHAVNGDCHDAVAALARARAHLESRDGHGRTPLMLAAQLGRQRPLQRLLAYGADAHAQDDNGYPAAAYAVTEHPHLLRFLEGPPAACYYDADDYLH